MRTLACGFKCIILLLAFGLPSSEAHCQLPFYTDDADITQKGKFHIEFSNEHDWLQNSSLPGKRQKHLLHLLIRVDELFRTCESSGSNSFSAKIRNAQQDFEIEPVFRPLYKLVLV